MLWSIRGNLAHPPLYSVTKNMLFTQHALKIPSKHVDLVLCQQGFFCPVTPLHQILHVQMAIKCRGRREDDNCAVNRKRK